VGAGADTGAGAPVLFFAISGSVGGSVGGSAAKQSFILQRHADGREVWSWLRDPGAYINLTIDDADDDGDGHDAPVIYIANATSNTIYRVVAGDETHRVEQVVRLASARRLGPMAFDPASHRLFVADLDRVPTRLYAIDVTRRRMLSMISLDAVDEIRSLVWDAVTQRLYAADSGQERIWRIDVASPPAPARAPARTSVQPQAEVGARPRTGHARVETLARHERMKQPVGMALTTSATDASGRSIWVVDHSARMALQMSMPDGVVTRILSCEPP
jgi:hypothetical protein